MIFDSNYQLELPAINTNERNDQTTLTPSILLLDFKAFNKEVSLIRFNYQGTDYFNILENISDLHSLMESVVEKLRIQLGGSNKAPYQSLSRSMDHPLNKNIKQIYTDTVSIAIILTGLKNLIKVNQKAVIEAEELKEFQLKSLLLEFEKELEWSRWIFHMLGKY